MRLGPRALEAETPLVEIGISRERWRRRSPPQREGVRQLIARQFPADRDFKRFESAGEEEERLRVYSILEGKLNRFWQRRHVRCQRRDLICFLRVLPLSTTRPLHVSVSQTGKATL